MIRLGLFVAGVRLAEWLPAWPLYRLALALGWLLSQVPSGPRRRLRRNLARVLQLPPQDPRLRPYLRRAYQLQATNYVDLLRARVMRPAAIAARVVRAGTGWDAFLQAIADKRGLVVVTAHFGRIEYLGHYLGHLAIPLTLPVERLRPPALFALLCRLRSRPTFHLVAHDAGLRPCLRALGRGEAVFVFADWDPTGGGVPVSFFGAPARLPGGPALLALRTGVPLFVGLSLPAEDPGQRLHLGPEIARSGRARGAAPAERADSVPPSGTDPDPAMPSGGADAGVPAGLLEARPARADSMPDEGAAPDSEVAAAGLKTDVSAGLLGGRVRALVEPPLPLQRTADFHADVQRATQAIAQALERHIRRYPEQWVMFHEVWP